MRDTVFQVFFQCMAMIVCFGALHGLIVLPVLLSLIGPPSHAEETGDSAKDDAKIAATKL